MLDHLKKNLTVQAGEGSPEIAGPPSRTGLRVLLGLVLWLKATWIGSYSVSSEHRQKQPAAVCVVTEVP